MDIPSILPQILPLLGVAIGALTTLLGTWITRQGEDRRALRQIARRIAEIKDLTEALTKATQQNQ